MNVSVKNILAKGEMATYENCFLSSQYFQKPSAENASESVDMWKRVMPKLTIQVLV